MVIDQLVFTTWDLASLYNRSGEGHEMTSCLMVTLGIETTQDYWWDLPWGTALSASKVTFRRQSWNRRLLGDVIRGNASTLSLQILRDAQLFMSLDLSLGDNLRKASLSVMTLTTVTVEVLQDIWLLACRVILRRLTWTGRLIFPYKMVLKSMSWHATYSVWKTLMIALEMVLESISLHSS